MAYKHLTAEQISILEARGCAAQDWSRVEASNGFQPERVRNVRFIGSVKLGANGGALEIDGVERAAGIENAALADCVIHSEVLISNIGGLIRGVDVGKGAAIVGCACVEAAPGAKCGQGVRVNAVNEAGGREVTLYSKLSAQTAWLESRMGHEKQFYGALRAMIAKEVADAADGPVIIGAGARLLHCGPIVDTAIGAGARIEGVARLENGTVLSHADAPAFVGAGVFARNFIFAEGCAVDSGAALESVYAGQGAKIGRQMCADHCLFFANCEFLNGEACAVFAGPHSVSHHKSTLLIASMTSFFNAGSGTNQSNHMYKLGPVHQAVLERGCKTGSSAYLLEDCHVGAFSVVIGKHMSHVQTPDLPFSYLIERQGETILMPGLNLQSVGVVRDARKWAARDRRPEGQRRDCLTADVFSPYTVEKMRRGRDILAGWKKSGPLRGLSLSDAAAKQGAALYGMAVDRYLGDWIVAKLEAGFAEGWSLKRVQTLMRPAQPLEDSLKWIDIAGLLLPHQRFAELRRAVAGGWIEDVAGLLSRLKTLHDQYAGNVTNHVAVAAREEFGAEPAEMTHAQLLGAIKRWRKASESLLNKALADGAKEFSSTSNISYGLEQEPQAQAADFGHVRGSIESNPVLASLREELAAVKTRTEALQAKIVKI